MMSKCTNSDAGTLLCGYEIGILSEEETRRFEEHLLECEHCYNELRSFEREAALLSDDAEIRALSDEASREGIESRSFVGRMWRHLWPDVPLVFRPALSYLAILVLLVPAYQRFAAPGISTVKEFEQVIRLSSARSIESALTRSESGDALLMFRCDRCRPGGTYRVVIESEDGVTVYRNDEFASFDERQIGALYLPVSRMEPGGYRLVISGIPADSAFATEEYPFRVEE